MPLETTASPFRPPFPTYLLPSLSFPRPSFQRRRSSTTSNANSNVFSAPTSPVSSANTSPSSSPPEPSFFTRRGAATVPVPIPEAVEQTDTPAIGGLKRTAPDTLKCSTCATDIAFTHQIVSKGFTGRHGKAYLVSPSAEGKPLSSLINTRVGRAVNRQLVTGAHVVADISCCVCSTVLGWKYVDAKELSQRYKIGKFILETKRIVEVKHWEDDDGSGRWAEESVKEPAQEVLFDSEDEDECEDLFSGTWDRAVVAKKRAKNGGGRKR